MNMIKAVIIDDIDKARVALKSDLAQYCPDVSVTGEADGVESGLHIINKVIPDLVFLDIRMGDGNGFDLIRKLEESGRICPKVIFTTAYDEFAIRAFRFSAVDYLLKPVDPEDLKEAIFKVRNKIDKEEIHGKLEVLMSNIRTVPALPKRIALNSADKIQVVNVEEIVRCESQSNYTVVVLLTGKQIIVTRTLKEFEEMLEVYDFLRIHNSHLINPACLKEYRKTESLALMSDNSLIPVSVRKKDQLMKYLGL